ncbi:MAG TPA: GNAT family N-acetyltransferase [Thermoanaerobaculaceae bacterium]|nr:GNAT family N-acetyltransferase [Thermoanaerobaculaceae bacterium]HPS77352.1 GNAT family N-acetyltransferase [Thermoanaerobaculaceae bacterium]
MSELTFRTEVRTTDGDAVRRIVMSSGFFNPDEIDVAVGLVDEHLAEGEASGYHFVFVEQDGEVIGYGCFGPIACTRSSFDFFWIAVQEGVRGQGVGRRLVEVCEARMRQLGATRIYVETSGREQYAPTRHFYLRFGYHEAAVFPDFYAPGDDKVVYLKVLG